MGRKSIHRVVRLVFSAALLAGALPVAAVAPDYYLVGLGLHQETGRDIYLGGVYLRQSTARPDSLEELSGPRIMEYRIVARRTSIRSLLGGILLQSEIATGQAPGPATAELANSILSGIRTSLYAGDSLEIHLNHEGDTIARLNGIEIDRVPDANVTRYLFAGWVSQNGPSNLFRRELMASEIDPALLSILVAKTCSQERSAEVASWFSRADDEPAPGAQTVAVAYAGAESYQAHSTRPITDTDALPVPAEMRSAPSIAAQTVSLVEDADTQAAPGPGLEPVLELTQAGEHTVQVAALTPTAGMLQESTLDPLAGLGVQEYSQRLANFHSELVAKVYGRIQYPKRAVRRQLQGSLELDVTLNASGALVGIGVANSSGHKLLDDAAIEAARKALSGKGMRTLDPVAIAEFGNGANELIVPVPVSFRLEE